MKLLSRGFGFACTPGFNICRLWRLANVNLSPSDHQLSSFTYHLSSLAVRDLPLIMGAEPFFPLG